MVCDVLSGLLRKFLAGFIDFLHNFMEHFNCCGPDRSMSFYEKFQFQIVDFGDFLLFLPLIFVKSFCLPIDYI